MPPFPVGWVEFLDKKLARRVAEALNGTIFGGKKSSYYHDDIWCIKYLPRFKWHHLTDKSACVQWSFLLHELPFLVYGPSVVRSQPPSPHPRCGRRYDKAAREKRLAAEMAQVRRETDQFVAQVAHAKRMEKAREMQGDSFKLPEREWKVKQRAPLEE